MLKLRIILLAIVVSVGAVFETAPAHAQLLPLPFPTKTKKKPTPTPTLVASPTITPTVTITVTPPAITATPVVTATPTATATPLPTASPMSTVTGTPTPAATTAALPDMVPAIQNVFLELNASVASGDFAEGCAEAMTGVDLLRFTALSQNVGNADLILGDPGCPSPCVDHPLEVCADPDFVCSPAAGHNHAHYNNYARYELLDGEGGVVVVGHKQGYCLRDTNCDSPVYTCANQGVSAGCYDTYDYTLGCQYLDVTDIPAGDYLLRVIIDPLNKIEELSDANNVAQQMVTISRPDVPTPTRTVTPTPTPTETVTPIASTTPTVTLTPPPFATATVTPTPTAGRTATVTPPIATTTAVATPTALPSATGTALPVVTATLLGTPSPVVTPSPTATASPTVTPALTPATEPSATATPSGGNPDGPLAAACQRALLKAGRTLTARTLAGLDACASAVSSCEAPRRRTAGCRERATASCTGGIAKIGDARTAFVEYVTARCAGAGDAELLAAAGLGFARRAAACRDDFGVSLGAVDTVAACLTRQHVCRTGSLQEIEEPRTGARLRQGAALAADLCIADLGGADPDAPPLEDARPLDACTRAVRRAGRSFARHRLGTLQSCLAAHASCFKPSANPAACERRAEEICAARRARLAPDLARLVATVQRGCSALDFTSVRAEGGANLDAIAPRCAALGIPALHSLADYEQCVARQHACAVDELLRFQAPRADDWIGDWPAPGGACSSD